MSWCIDGDWERSEERGDGNEQLGEMRAKVG